MAISIEGLHLIKLESPSNKDIPGQISMPVVHEKNIVKDLSKFPIFCPLNDPKTTKDFLSTS